MGMWSLQLSELEAGAYREKIFTGSLKKVLITLHKSYKILHPFPCLVSPTELEGTWG